MFGSKSDLFSSHGYRNQANDSLITRISNCYYSLKERSKRSSRDFATLVSEIQKLDTEFQRQLDEGRISNDDKIKYEVCRLFFYYK